MNLQKYVSEHQIILIGCSSSDIIFSDLILDNPNPFFDSLQRYNVFVSEILWWERVKVGEKSILGGGGPCDPRDSNYYFSETFMEKNFSPSTVSQTYKDYVKTVSNKYPDCDLYPSLTIKIVKN